MGINIQTEIRSNGASRQVTISVKDGSGTWTTYHNGNIVGQSSNKEKIGVEQRDEKPSWTDVSQGSINNETRKKITEAYNKQRKEIENMVQYMYQTYNVANKFSSYVQSMEADSSMQQTLASRIEKLMNSNGTAQDFEKFRFMGNLQQEAMENGLKRLVSDYDKYIECKFAYVKWKEAHGLRYRAYLLACISGDRDIMRSLLEMEAEDLFEEVKADVIHFYGYVV